MLVCGAVLVAAIHVRKPLLRLELTAPTRTHYLELVNDFCFSSKFVDMYLLLECGNFFVVLI